MKANASHVTLDDGTKLMVKDKSKLLDYYYNAVADSLLGNNDKSNPLFPHINKAIENMTKSKVEKGNVYLKAIDQLVSETSEYLNKSKTADIGLIEYSIAKTLFEWQIKVIRLLNNSKKITMLCGRRSGKSYLEAALAVLHCAVGYDTINGYNKPRSVLIVGLTKSKAKDIFWGNIQHYIEIAQLPAKIDNGDLTVHFDNGSEITLTGNVTKTEREKLRGGEFSLIVIDECQSQNQLQYLIVDILQPIATGRDSTFILSGTGSLTGKGFWKDITESPEWSHITATMKDNPTVPENALQSVLESNKWDESNVTYRREYLAENIIDSTRMVYPVYYKAAPDTKDIITNIVIGIDYGSSDYNAIVGLVLTNKSKIYEVACKKFNKSDVTTIVKEISTMADYLKDKFKADIICVADNSDQSISREVQRHHIKISNAYKVDRTQQIFDLREALRRGDVLIDSKIIADEMDNYVWKWDEEAKSVVYETDDDYYHPDALDALRYGYYYLAHRIKV